MPVRGSLRDLLLDSARAWSWPRRALVVLWATPLLIAISGVAAALLGKSAFEWLTREDGIAETLQVGCYVVAFVLSLGVLRRRARENNRLITILYACLTGALFFMIGEELSWGQRLFGWETPEVLSGINKQGETTLHNIHGVGPTFKWAQLFVGAYGALLPLAVLAGERSHFVLRHSGVLAMLIPHYSLIPYFAPMMIWRIYRNVFPVPERYYYVVAEYNEVVELVLALGLVLFLVFQLRTILGKDRQPVTPSE